MREKLLLILDNMPIIKDGKTYYTLDESIAISDKRIKENAKIFAQKVIQKQKENVLLSEEVYV